MVLASGGAVCAGDGGGGVAAVGRGGWTGGLVGAGARSSPVSAAGEVTGRAPNRIQPSSPLGTRTLDHASCSSKIVNSILLAAGTVAMIAYCSPGPARNVMDGRSPEEAGTGARTRASMHIHRDADNHVQARRRSRYLDDIACSFSHLWSLRPLIRSLADAPETDHYQHLCQFTPRE